MSKKNGKDYINNDLISTINTVSTYESIFCPVCGLFVKQSGKGRPKERHTNCRKIEQLFSWLEDELSVFDAPVLAKKKIRSRLFYLSNLMNSKKSSSIH